MRHTRRDDCTAGLIAALLLCVGGCGGGGGATSGGPVASVLAVDQQYDPTGRPTDSQAVSPVGRLAQTFTAGTTGRLMRVDLLIQQTLPGPLVMSIHPTAAGAPVANDSAVMAIVFVPDGNIPYPAAWHTFDLSSSDVHVTAGTTYAVVLSAPAAAFRWEGHALPTDEYLGGGAFVRDPTGSVWDSQHPVDLGFRAWVGP